jgi:hypothetical protein
MPITPEAALGGEPAPTAANDPLQAFHFQQSPNCKTFIRVLHSRLTVGRMT